MDDLDQEQEVCVAEAPEPGRATEGVPAEEPGLPGLPAPTEEAAEAAPEDLEGADDAEAAGDPVDLPPLAEAERRELARDLVALLFASSDALSLARLKALTGAPTAHLRQGLEAIDALFAAGGVPVVLRRIAGGWRLFSAPDRAAVVERLAREKRPEQISPAALETLAIVAYRQPVTKAEVDAIRGVQSGPMLRGLADRGLVKVLGRADQPGSPLVYGTTRDFLDRFGLADLKALPRDAELASS